MGESNQFRIRHRKTAKVTSFLVIILFLLILCGNSQNAYAYSARTVGTSANVVIEKDSLRVLCGENIYKRMEPASTTKILTAITVIENCDVYQTYEIPQEAVGIEGSSIYLKLGERWRIIDLLYGLMLRSGNDASVALAIATSGSVDEFVKLMNQTSFKAGAYSSSFSNPHGLHSDTHYTTAYDLALITAYAENNELFKEICQAKSYRYVLDGESRIFTNKNKLLFSYDGADGYKTGYTKKSGRCLVAGANRHGMQLISVVLNEGDMWNKSISLLDYCFNEYSLVTVQSKGDPIVVDLNGRMRTLSISRDLIYPLTDEEQEMLTVDYVLDRGNINDNDVQGYLTVRLENNLIFSEKLYRM